MRYIVIPIGPEPHHMYVVGAALRGMYHALRSSIHEVREMYGHGDSLSSLFSYLLDGDEVPAEFTHPLLGPDVDPEDSALIDLLMTSSAERRIKGAQALEANVRALCYGISAGDIPEALLHDLRQALKPDASVSPPDVDLDEVRASGEGMPEPPERHPVMDSSVSLGEIDPKKPGIIF